MLRVEPYQKSRTKGMCNVAMWTVVVCKGDCGLLLFDVIGGYPTLLLTIDTPPCMEVHFR